MNGEDRLYELLPAIYRERDDELGGPLRALLRIIQEQSDLLEADIRQLWDDFFIETCEPWVVPYLGDLVGSTPLFDAGRLCQPATAEELFPDLAGPRLIPEVTPSRRADVAKTIYYRRRQGTLPMLEELARDVTGWAAHAVDFFTLLGWTQQVGNHLRRQSVRTPDLRQTEPLERLNGPFDEIAHTVDVRPLEALTGWYDVGKLGLFLWRLRSYEAEKVKARRVESSHGYTFSPLGNPAPLFSRPRREADEAGLASELDVPGPIRPSLFAERLDDFYGPFDVLPGPGLLQEPTSSLMIVRDGHEVRPKRVCSMDLASWCQPEGKVVGVDVRRGRLAFGTGWKPAKHVDVWYHSGFSADLGGGSYPRPAWLVRRGAGVKVIQVEKSGTTPRAKTSLKAALAEWAAGTEETTILSILDSQTYRERVKIQAAPGRHLVIEAADEVRPHLRVKSGLVIEGEARDASVTLSGLLVEGPVRVDTRSLGRLRILHCTLVPGRALDGEGLPVWPAPSLEIEGGPENAPWNEELRVEIAFSITGPLRIPEHAQGAWILDSIVDGVGMPALSGPRTWLERVTVFGSSRVKELALASETIFTGPVDSRRRQEGCVRFSFVPDGSRTPRRYRCQPDEEHPGLVPMFTSTRYGQPAYAQLDPSCPGQIRTGAEDGSEMGAFCHLKQPQREANLRLRLAEHLPSGLEPGLLYVT